MSWSRWTLTCVLACAIGCGCGEPVRAVTLRAVTAPGPPTLPAPWPERGILRESSELSTASQVFDPDTDTLYALVPKTLRHTSCWLPISVLARCGRGSHTRPLNSCSRRGTCGCSGTQAARAAHRADRGRSRDAPYYPLGGDVRPRLFCWCYGRTGRIDLDRFGPHAAPGIGAHPVRCWPALGSRPGSL
jgi:hypothetical protein